MRVKSKTFHASQFTDARFGSAKVKAAFANQFVRFCETGFNHRFFTKMFYRQLHQMFGFIAHYSWHGFYNYYFTDDHGLELFIRDCQTAPIYRVADWSDVEQALQDWLNTPNLSTRLLAMAKYTEAEREEFGNSHE